MKPIFTLALFATLLLNAPATMTRADDLAPAAVDAATASLPGVKCVLRAANGQTQFRQGETIPLVASFTSDRAGYKINRFVRNDRGMATLGAVQVLPAENVADPLRELPPPNFLTISGYVPEPVALGKKPVEFPFVLNDWARFDKSGVYQITLTTARVFVSKPGDRKRGAGIFLSASNAAQITSEPLQIEITPADETWANQQVELWREYWDKKVDVSRSPNVTPPANDISFLGTRAAMTAIIEHLGQNTQPRSSGDDSYAFRTGLIGFADRAWLIAEMKRAIERPDYAVTQGFLDLLSELQSLQTTPRPPGADATRVKYEKDAQGKWVAQAATPAQQLQIDWQKQRAQAQNAAQSRAWLQVAAASQAKTGAARVMTLHSLLELAWLSNLEKEPPIKAQLPKLVAQLAPVFDQLPTLPRVYLLGDEWDRIKSPALVPALERARKLPVDKNDYDAKDAADLTLKRLAELDPKLGRAQIIEQIKRPQSGVDFQTLRALPDATLPALDEILATNFENSQGADNTLVARLIWRYSSAATLPRLKQSFEAQRENMDAAALEAMLAYFLRVAPTYGEAQLETTLRGYRNRDYSALLFEIASLQPSPLLQQVAIAYLDDAGIGVEADAAKTLARYGSPDAQVALLNRLKSQADIKYPRARARLEAQFFEALANAQSWLCPPDKLRQIRALCRTDAGRRVADEYLRARTDGEPLVANYSSGTHEFWSVDRYAGRGLKDLRAKLAQFTRGTEFFWQTLSRGPDATAAFETTRKWAAERGLKVESYEKIIARRKALGLN